MNVSALDNYITSKPRLAQLGGGRLGGDQPEGFSLTIDALTRARDRKAAETDLRESAEQFVSTSLLTPLLAQVRDDPFKSDLFHGGFTEDAFMQQFDQIIADRLSKRMSLPLVDTIYNQIADMAQRSGPAALPGALPGAGAGGEVDLRG